MAMTIVLIIDGLVVSQRIIHIANEGLLIDVWRYTMRGVDSLFFVAACMFHAREHV